MFASQAIGYPKKRFFSAAKNRNLAHLNLNLIET